MEELSVEALIAQAAEEARLELAEEAAEDRRLHAAFEAGTPLEALVPLDLYDPIDRDTVRVPAQTVLTVASHEGDVLVGTLADNTHSLGVVWEEPHRWTPRKYFLPLAAVVDEAKVRVAAEAAGDTREARGAALDGADGATGVAVHALAELVFADERAVLPRGSALILKDGATTVGGRHLKPGTVVVVREAVADFDLEGGLPPIPVRVDGANLELPYEVLAGLDPREDMLDARGLAAREQAAASRRRFLRVAGGVVGLGAMLGADAVWYRGGAAGRSEEEHRRMVLSAVTPQLGAAVGYFGAGGKYWYELRGKLFDLAAQGCLEAVRPLSAALDRVAGHTAGLWSTYEATFHRTVHTHWSEQKHYRTDKDGKRHYTHSTWSKGYSSVWCEPPGLEGWHGRVSRWSAEDGRRARLGRRLHEERIFQLLETAPGDAERDFGLDKRAVGFARDAFVSALSAALCVLPAAFYDDLVNAVRGRGTIRYGSAPLRKPGLLVGGCVAGIVLAELHRRRLNAQLTQNKYDLGQTLEAQLGRVPTLSFEAAWREHFGEPTADQLPDWIRGRLPDAEHVAAHARSFTYIHGSGYDNGRPLDPEFVVADPVRERFSRAGPPWLAGASALEAALRPDRREQLLPVLRNVVGTTVLDALMEEDEAEAKGGSWKRGAWFALPVWGAAVVDAVLAS